MVSESTWIEYNFKVKSQIILGKKINVEKNRFLAEDLQFTILA